MYPNIHPLFAIVFQVASKGVLLGPGQKVRRKYSLLLKEDHIQSCSYCPMKLNVDDKVELLVTKEQREVSQGIEAIAKESRGCLLPKEFEVAAKKADGQLGGVVKQTDGKAGNVDLYTAGSCRMRRKIENMVNKKSLKNEKKMMLR